MLYVFCENVTVKGQISTYQTICGVDGYDNETPFGFSVSGSIDGFSRHVLWLICEPTKN